MIASGGKIIFTDRETQDLHRLDPSTGEVERITDTDTTLRYACTSAITSSAGSKSGPEWLLAIEEDHTKPLPSDVRNRLVAVNIQSKKIVNVASDDDFYSAAQFSPDGSRICWNQWSHPDMPWTGARVYVANWNDGRVTDISLVAGVPEKESVSQPRWGVDNTLYFTTDRSGYWQLYRFKMGSQAPQRLALRGLEEVEFSEPDWRLGKYVRFDYDESVKHVNDDQFFQLYICRSHCNLNARLLQQEHSLDVHLNRFDQRHLARYQCAGDRHNYHSRYPPLRLKGRPSWFQ